ncbi:hypothetical protein GDO81_021481, partial [Engystomops pustulosus]
VFQLLVNFSDVAVYFSDEEWRHLEEWQKHLYMEVMQENLETLLSLEDIFLHFEELQENAPSVSSILPIRRDKDNINISNLQYKKPVHDVLEDLDKPCSVPNDHKVDHRRNKLPSTLVGEALVNLQNPGIDTLRSLDTHDRASLEDLLLTTSTIQTQDDEKTKIVDQLLTTSHKSNKVLSNSESIKLSPGIHTTETRNSFSRFSKDTTNCILLAEHEKLHRENKSFPCPDCGKTFIRKCILKLHRRTHTGERPFACTECGKRFSQRFNLVIHQRIHTGEKPYTCHTCDKGFRYKPALVRHEKEGTCVRHLPKTQVIEEKRSNGPNKTSPVPSCFPISHLASFSNTVDSKLLRPLSSSKDSRHNLQSLKDVSAATSSSHPPARSKFPSISNSHDLSRKSSALTRDQSSVKTLLAAPSSVCSSSGNITHSASSTYRPTQRRHPPAKSLSLNTKASSASAISISCSSHTKTPLASDSSISHSLNYKSPLDSSFSSMPRTLPSNKKLTLASRYSQYRSPAVNLLSSTSVDTIYQSSKKQSVTCSTSCQNQNAKLTSSLSSARNHPSAAEHPASSIMLCSPASCIKTYSSHYGKCSSLVTSTVHQSCIKEPPTSACHLPTYLPAISRPISHSRLEKPYKCSQCKKVFGHLSHLVEHQKSHTGSRNICPECNKSFIRKSTLILHKRTHTGERPYVCTECGRRFSQHFNLVVHQRIHTGENPYVCPECHKSFRYRTSLIRHQRDGPCKKKLPTENSSVSNLPQSPPTKDRTLSSPSASQQTQKVRNYDLPEVIKTFRMESPLKTWKSIECRTSFSPLAPLGRHLKSKRAPSSISEKRSVHTGPYKVNIWVKPSSDIAWKGIDALYSTLQSPGEVSLVSQNLKSTGHNPIDISPYCPPVAKRRPKSSSCVFDNRTSPDPRWRTVKNLYKCDQCRKCFSHSDQYVEHQAMHSGGHHRCTMCNKVFGKSSQLVLHQRTHTGEKPYSCGKCDKNFSQKFNLVVHQRIHTGEKPFICAQCSKAFRYRSGLLKHQKYDLCA